MTATWDEITYRAAQKALEQDELVAYSKTDVAATTWAVLIDCSSELWPGLPAASVDIDYISMQVDKAANAIGRLQVGVVTRVDATNGDVTVFRGLIFESSTDDHIERAENFNPHAIRTMVTGGTTPHILSGTRILNDTGIQTDVALDSPLGAATVFPAVGDIVIRFLHTSGAAFSGAVTCLYAGAT